MYLYSGRLRTEGMATPLQSLRIQGLAVAHGKYLVPTRYLLRPSHSHGHGLSTGWQNQAGDSCKRRAASEQVSGARKVVMTVRGPAIQTVMSTEYFVSVAPTRTHPGTGTCTRITSKKNKPHPIPSPSRGLHASLRPTTKLTKLRHSRNAKSR